MNEDPLIILGVITAAHGVRGAVKIKPFTGSPDDLLSYGTLRDRTGKPYNLRITGEAKGQLIATLDGLTDRNDAELLRGTELGVARSALPETDEDEYYIEDMVGLRVTLADGSDYGRIAQVYNAGAGDIIDITRLSDNKSESMPFTEALFPQVDIAAGHVTFCPPEIVVAEDESNEQQGERA